MWQKSESDSSIKARGFTSTSQPAQLLEKHFQLAAVSGERGGGVRGHRWGGMITKADPLEIKCKSAALYIINTASLSTTLQQDFPTLSLFDMSGLNGLLWIQRGVIRIMLNWVAAPGL